MGNNQSLQQQIAIYQPPPNQLVLIDPGVNFRIYQHRQKMFEVMAHKFTLNSQDDLQLMVENFIARYQHHYLVSTMYLKCDDYSTCGGYIQAIVFYQRIFTNLSKIKDIPINDALHFYAVAFKGFQILYQRFGYFQIYEDMFFLAQDSKLKVWCNRDISKNQPQQYLRDKTGRQQDMVRKIIFVIGQNTDPLTDNIKLKQRLIANGVRNFQMALQSLREICRQFNLSVPQRVQCMVGLPSEEVRSVLDQYATNMRKVSNETNAKAYGGYMVASGGNNNMMNSNGNHLNTPHFVDSTNLQASHAPITQQFSLPNNSQKLLTQVTSPFTPSILPPQPSPMLQTFNKNPQTPTHDSRKGIDLSLSTKKDRPPSVYMKKSQSAMLSSRNNNSVDNKVQRVLSPQIMSNSNYFNNNNLTRKSPQTINKNGLLNTQVHHYDNIPKQQQIKPYYPQQVTLGQQFSKPTVQVRPNYHFLSNGNVNNINLIQQQQHQPKYQQHQPKYQQHQPKYQYQQQQSPLIITNSQQPNIINHQIQQQQFIPQQGQPTINITNNTKTYHSHSQPKPPLHTSSQPIRKPSILKHQSSILMKNSINNNNNTLKKSNIVHVNFVNNNNNSNNQVGPFSQSPSKYLQYQQQQQRRYIPQSSINVNGNNRYEQSTQISINNNNNTNPIRQKRASTRQKNISYQQKSYNNSNDQGRKQNQNVNLKQKQQSNAFISTSIVDLVSSGSSSMLKKNASTPILGMGKNADKPKSNPFQLVQNSQVENFNLNNKNYPPHPPPSIPLTSPSPSPFFTANSTSSRYLHSNKQLNDNIPDLKYYKKQQPKKTINKLFDTKIQQLQSFNSFKEMNNQNSQVLQIIGREKKDSITSAFDQQQKWVKIDEVKQQKYGYNNNNDVLKFDNIYKNSDSFTDPKILEILKRPSSKALKNQLNSLKKTAKGTKMYEFSKQTHQRRPQVVNQQQFFDSNNKNVQNFNNATPSQQDFQGFPSLSNLSQINKLEQNTTQFNYNYNNNQQQKSSPLFFNNNNSSNNNKRQQSGGVIKKSRFSNSQQNNNNRFSGGKYSSGFGMSNNNKKQQQHQVGVISEFYNANNTAINTPTYQYSFSSKKQQIPIQDNNQWRSKYATSMSNNSNNNRNNIIHNNKYNNNNKQDPINLINSRNSNSASNYGQFKVVIPEKPYNGFMERFNSNQSLASLQFQLSKKLVGNAHKQHDGIKQQDGEIISIKNGNIKDDEFYRVRVSNAEKQTVSNRKYNPALDPQIGRDLEMFRKQKKQIPYNK